MKISRYLQPSCQQRQEGEAPHCCNMGGEFLERFQWRAVVEGLVDTEEPLDNRVDGDVVLVKGSRGMAMDLIVKRIMDAGGDLYHVSEEKMSLEEIYFSLIDSAHEETEREQS